MINKFLIKVVKTDGAKGAKHRRHPAGARWRVSKFILDAADATSRSPS